MKMNFNFIFIIRGLQYAKPANPFPDTILGQLGLARVRLVDRGRRDRDQASRVYPASANPGQQLPYRGGLIEEAYNQEDGVVQHISYLQRSLTARDWVFTQTDEWPFRTIKHQLSITMAAAHSGAGSGWGFGDTLINYRYQLAGNGEAKLAIAPRLSLILPSGSFRFGRGNGGLGMQTNVPVSLQHNRWLVTHWNGGMSWLPYAHNAQGQQAGSLDFNVGQSIVWLASTRLNALVETLWTSTASVSGVNTIIRRQDVYVSPGVRWAHNFASGLQIVPGVGVPVGVGPSAGQRGLILYLSFEHPLAIAHSR